MAFGLVSPVKYAGCKTRNSKKGTIFGCPFFYA